MGLLLICIGYIMCIWVNYIILHIPFNIEVDIKVHILTLVLFLISYDIRQGKSRDNADNDELRCKY